MLGICAPWEHWEVSDNVETQAESVTHFMEYQEKMEERIISSDGVKLYFSQQLLVLQ